MNIEQALKIATAKFKEANIETASLDARLLLSHTLSKPVEYLLLESTQNLTHDEQEAFLKTVEERVNLKPLAYILGYKEFHSLEFKLNDQILIPRVDTEILIDAVLASLPKQDVRILDLGCGSGCIIITLLSEILQSTAVACDISPDAINFTRKNAALHNIAERLEVIHSDWFKNIKPQKFDIIVSNPPYIASHERPLMAKETLLHEPDLALFANDNGLEAYKIIAKQAANFLQNDGKLFVEIGFNQAGSVQEIFTSSGYELKEIFKDLTNHNRVLSFMLCDLKTH